MSRVVSLQSFECTVVSAFILLPGFVYLGVVGRGVEAAGAEVLLQDVVGLRLEEDLLADDEIGGTYLMYIKMLMDVVCCLIY